jgi:putative membrane protein
MLGKTFGVALGFAMVSNPVLAQGYGPGYGGYGYGHFMGPLSGLLMFLMVVLIIVGAVLLVRRLWHHGGSGDAADKNDALRLLDERYAKGEIDREDYLQRKQDLTG